LDPVGIGTKWRGFSKRSDDELFVERFLAQEGWLADPVPMTARVLRDIVHDLYRDNALAQGTLRLNGACVDLARGTVPVLNLIARWDSIVPGPASRALEALWGGPVETHELRGGHIGVTVGSRAPEGMWKLAGEWLERDHD
jgi:polyhydroxyalkanoate synthase